MLRYFWSAILLLLPFFSPAQLKLSLEDCDALLQKNNLLLLAEQYNIDANKAAVIQARIWDQPVLSAEANLLNPEKDKVFDIGKTGQKALAIQQLIYLGGKKKNEIEFAKSNVALAEIQFEQLLRTLKFEMHQSFYDLYFEQNMAQTIKAQLSNIDTLISIYTVQAKKGNIPLKDVVRLQSLSMSLKSQVAEIQQKIFDQEENLKVLTGLKDNIAALDQNHSFTKKYFVRPSLSQQDLEQKVLNNPDYKYALKNIERNELNVKWQKALATPDITLGASYDQNGGAFKNQVNFTVGMPLPLWNRNRGNIKIAEAQLAQSKVLKDQKNTQLFARVGNIYQTFLFKLDQYNSTITNFENFETVYQGILQNFQKRNISLIEFTDFMESYNQSLLYLNEIKKQVIINAETLNYLTNENLF